MTGAASAPQHALGMQANARGASFLFHEVGEFLSYSLAAYHLTGRLRFHLFTKYKKKETKRKRKREGSSTLD